jgi:hypothetical protein
VSHLRDDVHARIANWLIVVTGAGWMRPGPAGRRRRVRADGGRRLTFAAAAAAIDTAYGAACSGGTSRLLQDYCAYRTDCR